MREILTRANLNEICKLEVECTTAQAKTFWSKFGFEAVAEYSDEFYRILKHELKTQSRPDQIVKFEFFKDGDWHCRDSGGVPYKTMNILSVVTDNEILLSEICHDANIENGVFGDRRVRVFLNGEIILDDWFDTDQTKEFGFYYNPFCNSYCAKILRTRRITERA